MISAKRATKIVFEMDGDKRNKLVDELSEEDAKYLLKQCLTTMRNGTNPDFALTGTDEKSVRLENPR